MANSVKTPEHVKYATEIKAAEDRLNNGSVFEEDIETAVEKAVALFGPQGSVRSPAFIKNNVVWADGFGFIWYGDLREADVAKIRQLALDLNTTVVLIDEFSKIKFYGKVDLDRHTSALYVANVVALADGTFAKYRWAK